MRGLNKVMLIGNVGKEIDFKILETGVSVAKLNLATTDTFTDKNGQSHSDTEWHTIILWRGLAELAQQYLHTGSLIYVEGKIKTRNYEAKDGFKKYVTEIVADTITMLDKKESV